MAVHAPANPIDRLLSVMESTARFARDSVRRSREEFGPGWEADFGETLARLYGSEPSLHDAVKGYGAFAMDAMRRQKRFEKELAYPAKTYAEAAAEVYFNEDYMRSQYLPGLLLSHYLWPHHYQQLHYFRSFYLSWAAQQGTADLAEVGVGTGLYSRVALQTLPQARGTGFDISPMSLDFTQAHVQAFGLQDRFEGQLTNILTDPGHRTYAAVVCVEVLEHLEDPTAMLRGLRDITTPRGRLFVTAALNAANADHIHLYRRPEDVLAQVESAGLHLEHCFHARAYAPAEASQPVPASLAMVLSRRE